MPHFCRTVRCILFAIIALGVLDVAAEILVDPDELADAAYNEAADLQDDEKYEAAIKYYKRAIKLNKTFVEAYYNMATCYGRIKDYQSAIKIYKKTIGLDPDSGKAREGLGNAYLQLARGTLREYKKYMKSANRQLKQIGNSSEGARLERNYRKTKALAN